MLERQPVCVKRLASEWNRHLRPGALGVQAFADQGVPMKPGLNADLISLARLQPYLQERSAAQRLEHAVMGHSLLFFRIARMRSLLEKGVSVPHQIVAPGSLWRPWMSVHDGKVQALGDPPQKLILQVLLRANALREHHEARRIAIDPVHRQRLLPPAGTQVRADVVER